MGGTDVQSPHFSCMCPVWSGKKCLSVTAAPGSCPGGTLLNGADRHRPFQQDLREANGLGAWEGERGMEWDDLNGNNHNFYGKSWAGQTREKGRWRVKERQGSLREGEANGAKCYQAQAGRVQPSPFLLWLTPITCKLSWLRTHFHLWRAGKCPLEHIDAAVLQAVCLLWGQGIDMSQVWQTPGVLPCAPFFVQRCLYPEL